MLGIEIMTTIRSYDSPEKCTWFEIQEHLNISYIPDILNIVSQLILGQYVMKTNMVSRMKVGLVAISPIDTPLIPLTPFGCSLPTGVMSGVVPGSGTYR